MKFGLKLWSSNVDLFQDAVSYIHPELFQYIELTAIPGTDLKPWLEHKIPFVIHAPTEKQGLNIGENRTINKELLKNSIRWADELEAEYVIIHPGFGNLDIALDFLEEIEDTRILIENMPKIGITDEKMLGVDILQLQKLMGNKFGFCLDVNHAMKAAISMEIDGIEFIRELDKLKPKMYHIADGTLKNEKDEHLHLGQGEYDLTSIMKIIGDQNNYITLETPRKALKDDLRNLHFLQGIA